MREEDLRLPNSLSQSLQRLLAQLRCTILPVNPFDWMDGQVGAHRFAKGREKVFLAEARKQPKALQLVLDRILHLGKAELDAGSVQCIVKLADNISSGDVNTRDRLSRDHEPADGHG